jgi:hypothetical protein
MADIKVLIEAERDYVRVELLNGPKDITLLSQDGPVHRLQRLYHPLPLLLRQDGLGLMAHIHIPGNYYHQLVAQNFRPFQIENVAGMEKVKRARGDDSRQAASTGSGSAEIFIEIILKVIALKVVVFELHIQDGKVTPVSCCIEADPAMLIERRTDDDVIVSGAREELDIRFGGPEDTGGMAMSRARYLHVGKHIEPDECAHPRIFRAR